MNSADQDVDPSGILPAGLDNLLRRAGFKVATVNKKVLVVASDKARKGRRSIYDSFALPIEESQKLYEQLSAPVKPLSDHFGFFTEDGFFELMVRADRVRRAIFDPWVSRRIASLFAEDRSCEHLSSECCAIDITKHESPLLSTALKDVTPLKKTSDIGVVHVSDPISGACVELSPQSPCGILFGIENSAGDRVRFAFSIKVWVAPGVKASDVVNAAYAIANSFMYELAVRNGVFCEPINRAQYEDDDIPRRVGGRINDVRFPLTKVGPEVAELYSFAEHANGNPPLAFLSFYQVLEYFFPQAIRRAMIRDVKRELSDPRFSVLSDSDVMRVIGVAESGVRANEGEQIATLLDSAVREDRLVEFLNSPGNKTHFGRGGPILGVDTINVDNQREKLARQVANRVYQLRNRIVHAKDDPKYANVKVLLPRSREAAKLRPDIDLVRLLAQEVIVDSQV